MARHMATQQLSIAPELLATTKSIAARQGESWSAYVTRALRRQTMADNMRAAAELDQHLPAEEQMDRVALEAHRAEHFDALADAIEPA